MISNGFFHPVLNGKKLTKVYNVLSEERLKSRIEKVCLESGGKLLIPCSSKSRILQILVVLEHLFATNNRLSNAYKDLGSQKPIIYIEHMSIDTIGVAKSHLGWMQIKQANVFEDNPFNFRYIEPIFKFENIGTY